MILHGDVLDGLDQGFSTMNKSTISKIASAVLGVEGVLLPIFIHNPASGQIAGVILAAEEAMLSAFGLAPTVPGAAPAPATSGKESLT